jgi:hypothetical protein
MTNYVSFSLYGKENIYNLGAIENVKLCRTIYPGWVPVVYVDEVVPPCVSNDLIKNGALVIHGSPELSSNKRTWRFAASLIKDAEKVIFRDADSRISFRERACVDSWLQSDKALHVMRDHPHHANWIMAGMFGVDARAAGRYLAGILETGRGIEVGEDQKLLAKNLYPFLRKQSLVHDSFFRRETWATPFPTPREGGQFVGEIIDEHGNPDQDIRDMLVRFENSPLLRLQLLAEDYRRVKTEQNLSENLGPTGTILNYLRASSWRL